MSEPKSEGHRVLLARTEQGQTLAEMLDISPTLMSLIKSGKRLPSVTVKDRMQSALGIRAGLWDLKPRNPDDPEPEPEPAALATREPASPEPTRRDSTGIITPESSLALLDKAISDLSARREKLDLEDRALAENIKHFAELFKIRQGVEKKIMDRNREDEIRAAETTKAAIEKNPHWRSYRAAVIAFFDDKHPELAADFIAFVSERTGLARSA